MCIVEILDNWYNYVNISTGELKYKVCSTLDYPIRTIKLVDNSNIIYGTLMK